MEDAIEEGRLALQMLERQLQQKTHQQPLWQQPQPQQGAPQDIVVPPPLAVVTTTTNRLTTLSSERRLLDQAPRDLRLNNRIGSPLGLTIEELDDRGLLEGGMVPTYYASSRQRGRRPLEMKKRSSRLAERGKETITKMTNALFHMVRVLNKRGLHMEEYCLPRDTKGSGFVPKSHFVSVLRNIGLPFGAKDLNDVVLRYASAPKQDAVDYHAFLRDAGVKLKHAGGNNKTDLDDTRDGSIQSDLSAYTTFLFDMKRMLLESVQRLGKQPDDVYRMFARWDNEGSGTITAAQFLRVLMRLHVDLSDQDQDFLVELLDTTSMGRIDFESLLGHCFADVAGAHGEAKSPHPMRSFTDDNMNDITASTVGGPGAGAAGGAGDVAEGQSSVGSNNKNARRPHTASPSRHDLQFVGGGRGSPERGFRHDAGGAGHPLQRPTTASGRVASSVEYRTGRGRPADTATGSSVGGGGGAGAFVGRVSRPQSALGLRGVSDYVAERPDDFINDEDDYVESSAFVRPASQGSGRGRDDHHVADVKDAPTDALTTAVVSAPTRPESGDADTKGGAPYGDDNDAESADFPDGASFNDNTLLTEPDDYPHGGGAAPLPRDSWRVDSLDNSLENDHLSSVGGGGGRLSPVPPARGLGEGSALPRGVVYHGDSHAMYGGRGRDGARGPGRTDGEALPLLADVPAARPGAYYGSSSSGHGGTGPAVAGTSSSTAPGTGILSHAGGAGGGAPGPSSAAVHFDSDGASFSEPIDHLNLLASQTLATVRDLIVKRQQTGKALVEIFRHFDRKGKRFFTAQDFMRATADLRLETTERVAMLAVAQMALDGRDRVSFGEFCVFVMDPDHRELEEAVRAKAAALFERQGRAFQATLHSVFWEEDAKLGDAGAGRGMRAGGRGGSGNRDPRDGEEEAGLVSVHAFTTALRCLGLKDLTPPEINRLVTRFDLHGQGSTCSAVRFVRMVESGDAWQQAEAALAHQEVAAEEAALLRLQLKKQVYQPGTALNEEMIATAEYLGIKVISERHLLWIVRDALNAPLPSQWVVLKDSKGKAFYYNRTSNQSRWDHPLDPHFRKLRDQHRLQYQQQVQYGQMYSAGGVPGGASMGMGPGMGFMPSGYDSASAAQYHLPPAQQTPQGYPPISTHMHGQHGHPHQPHPTHHHHHHHHPPSEQKTDTLPAATASAPKIFHQVFQSKVDSYTRPLSAPNHVRADGKPPAPGSGANAAAKKGYPEYAEKIATAEHAYRPYSWTAGKAATGKVGAKPRATSATAGRRPSGGGMVGNAATATWGRPLSATDKAQSKLPQAYPGGPQGHFYRTADSKEERLAAMYGEDVIYRLDTAFAPKR